MPFAPRQLDSSTLADRAYRELRSAIMSGDLAAGVKITDRGLAESLAVSPTPVREAIRRLEQDRLVERLSPRAFRVASYSPVERAEISLIEVTLRALAARLAAQKITDAQLAELEDCLAQADAARATVREEAARSPESPDIVECANEVIKTLRRFHRLVNEASGNPILLHMLDMAEAFSLGERQRVLRQQLANQVPPPEERYTQHREILEALRAHNAEQAYELMSVHGVHARTDLLRLTP